MAASRADNTRRFIASPVEERVFDDAGLLLQSSDVKAARVHVLRITPPSS
jgi:hypothetical protein